MNSWLEYRWSDSCCSWRWNFPETPKTARRRDPRLGMRKPAKAPSASLPRLRFTNTSARRKQKMSEASIAGESTPGDQSERPSISCVASTEDRFHCTVEQSHSGWAKALYGTLAPPDKNQSNCFRHALLSADGTAVVTYNEDLILRTFAV